MDAGLSNWRERARRSIASSRLYERWRNKLQASATAPASSSLGRKLNKLRTRPEDFLREAHNPVLRGVGLYLYRALSLDDVRPLHSTELPHRSIVLWMPTKAPIPLWVEHIDEDTELLILCEGSAADVAALLSSVHVTRLRAYIFSGASPSEKLLRYGLDRALASRIVVATNPGRDLQPFELFRALRTQKGALVLSEAGAAVLRGSDDLAATDVAALAAQMARSAAHPPVQVDDNAFFDNSAFFAYPALSLEHAFGSPQNSEIFCLERTPDWASDTRDLPLVSIIMTVFNGAATVEAAVQSLLCQTHEKLELIIVDDCSSDGSWAILAGLAEDDARIRLLRTKQNSGTYWSKNFGLQAATGEILTFHDADDVSTAHRIELQVRALLADSSCAANQVRCQRLADDGALRTSTGSEPAFITLMFHRSAFEVVGYFDCVRIGADEELAARLQLATGTIIRVLPAVCYYARHAEGSLTTSGPGAFETTLDGRRHVPAARAAYRAAFQRWHHQLATRGDSPFLSFPPEHRPFTAPSEILSQPAPMRVQGR